MVLSLFFLLIGVGGGLVIGARLRSPQIWGAGFVAGAFAGMALTGRILMGVLYGRCRRSGQGGGGGKGQVLVRLWDRLQNQRGSEEKAIRSVSGVRRSVVRERRRWY